MTDFATIKADGSVTTRDPMIRNEGHIWVDPPTGWILKANLKWRDYPVHCQAERPRTFDDESKTDGLRSKLRV